MPHTPHNTHKLPMCPTVSLGSLEGIFLMIDFIVIPVHMKLVSRESISWMRQVQTWGRTRREEMLKGRARLAN